MNNKIRRQIKVARIPVHISTPLTEEVLQAVVAYVEEKYNLHEKTIGYKPDDEKKVDTLIITLLDVAAELISAKQEIKRLKQSDTEALAAVDILSKQLDDFSRQIEG
ncbi:MAG: cell division protein ZapA [Fibromonadaceae bacterium]|nr:cell division protein ZapA [Fibromonadaceae bacterium]